jgi:hypothetical protein
VARYATAFLDRHLRGRGRLGRRWLRSADDGTVAVTARPD